MGVPKFFRFLCERYPCLCEVISQNQIPEYDNLYLDMNGIIHVCSHPDDSDLAFRITEEKLFHLIFYFIDVLFRLIQPQKLFFMAIDGVAPRAKMNQQRGRRFRSAKEAETREEQAKKKGQELPSEARFDSNCITPGTEFMTRLQEALEHFVKMKMSTNWQWRKCRVILSGHLAPGEGEHKIMEYIRYLKAQPDYDPNTRHCLYGLDADLIMLGLCTHELNFFLLREEVTFRKQTKRVSEDSGTTRFVIVHLRLLREYLELEFETLKSRLSFEFNIENIIDDWILMCFLVGNDFIPHLPNLHISSNALPILYEVYKDVLPTLTGYINEQGIINLERFEKFFERLSELDMKWFEDQSGDIKYMKSKTGPNGYHRGGVSNAETFDMSIDEIKAGANDPDLAALVQATQDMFTNDEDNISLSSMEDGDDENDLEHEFRVHKRDYYMNKMHYPDMTDDVLREQAECFIRAIQWTISYYYRGVASWTWYYPFHYAPYISDVCNFAKMTFEFNIGKPALPFEQLLAVLPPFSKALLPVAYHKLMTDESSDIIEYYPENFDTDLNGKKQEWEAVVLIPFIQEDRLRRAMLPCNQQLTAEEKSRNCHGPMLQYDSTKDSKGPLKGRFNLPDINHMRFIETTVNREEVLVEEQNLKLGPSLVQSDKIYYSGFATMKHLSYTGRLEKARVKVFDQPSRNENMIIKIKEDTQNEESFEQLVEKLLGKRVYISWPYLIESKVVAISDKTGKQYVGKEKEPQDEKMFTMQLRTINDHHMGSLGVDIGKVDQLLHVQIGAGYHHECDDEKNLKVVNIWGQSEIPYPARIAVSDISTTTTPIPQCLSPSEAFAKGTLAFIMSTACYGSVGVIWDSSKFIETGRVEVALTVHAEPDFSDVRLKHADSKLLYTSASNAAKLVGIDARLFSIVTGNVLAVRGHRRTNLPENTPMFNLGLKLKSVKWNEQTSGYTMRNGQQWMYSPKTIELVNDYVEKFPKLFEVLSSRNVEILTDSDFMTNNGQPEEDIITNIRDWMKGLPHFDAPKQSCGSDMIEKSTIKNIIEAVKTAADEPPKKTTLQVKPELLYIPSLNYSHLPADAHVKFRVFDRVIVSKDKHMVPIGKKGTVIAISKLELANHVRFELVKTAEHLCDVLFDLPFIGGNSIHGVGASRFYTVPQNILINISYGNAKFVEQNNSGQPVDNWSQNSWRSRKNSQEQQQQQPAWNSKRPNFDAANWRKTVPIAPSVPAAAPAPAADAPPATPKYTLIKRNENNPKVGTLPALTKHDKDENRDKVNVAGVSMHGAAAAAASTSDSSTSEMKLNDIWKMLKKSNESQMIDSSNANRGTDALKKVLGIDGRSTELPSAGVKVPIQPPVSKLPAPPQNWRKSQQSDMSVPADKMKPSPTKRNQPYRAEHMQSNIQQSTLLPSMQPVADTSEGTDIVLHRFFQSILPQYVPYNSPTGFNNMGPLNTHRMPHSIMPGNHAAAFQMNYFPNNFVVPPPPFEMQRPNGPQHLRQHNNFSIGTGAFIPLQAARNSVRNRQTSGSGADYGGFASQQQQQPYQQHQQQQQQQQRPGQTQPHRNHQQKRDSVDRQFAAERTVKRTVPPATQPQMPVTKDGSVTQQAAKKKNRTRKSRIAAKFDNIPPEIS